MSFSRETTDKLNRFAKEQSQHYLDEAEMTYLEKLRRKTGQTKGRMMAKLAKFKRRSETSLEAQNDMLLYMSDYMSDLIAQGMSEQDALERAKTDLAFRSESAGSADLQQRFVQYYEHRGPAEYEAIGLFYAGFMFFGFAIGGLIGFVVGGGRGAFLAGGWMDTLIGVAAGVIIGLGLGMVSNAVIALNNRT
ncbi:hypothetical protein [Paenibacillus sp. 1P07SE]|uniref:hypothetical protein n=1 Tax=Paenibacillus sp. 1P07SE TaxID=3132209 RepID=UPI0039A4C43E